LLSQDTFYGKKLGSGPDSEVEVDETFIGGKARNMHKSRKAELTGNIDEDKAVVVGFLERGGRVRTQIVTKRKSTICNRYPRTGSGWSRALHRRAQGLYRTR